MSTDNGEYRTVNEINFLKRIGAWSEPGGKLPRRQILEQYRDAIPSRDWGEINVNKVREALNVLLRDA